MELRVGPEGLDEVGHIAAGQRPFLQGELHVGPQVIHRRRPGARLGPSRQPLEEQHVGLNALAVEDAGGQAQDGVQVEFVQQAAAQRLAGSALEQHIVGQHHGGRSARLQHGNDVLKEVQLLVSRLDDEVVADTALLLRPDANILARDAEALPLAERRVGQDYVEPGVAPVG